MNYLGGLILLVTAMMGTVGCSISDERATPGQQSTLAPTSAGSSSAESTVTTSPSSAPRKTASRDTKASGQERKLKKAVTDYSDAFLDAEPVKAYELLSSRCRETVSLSYFTGIVTAAKMTYGAALPIKTFDAEIDGKQASVTYTYDVPALNQEAEPWVKERSGWKNDQC